MKIKKLIFIVVLILLMSCGKKEIEVNKPYENIKNESINEKDIHVKTTEAEILSFEDKEAMFMDYIQWVGGDEQNGYLQNLNSAKERGEITEYIYDEDGYIHSEKRRISADEYMDEVILKLKELYPDMEERQGEDWKYVSDILNMPDFGTYKEAFYSANNEFYSNSLKSGVFNCKDEIDKAYNDFIVTKNMKEKALYLKKLLENKNNKIKDNKTILEDYINEIINVIYGNDASKIEIKAMGINSIDSEDIRFNYVIGEKVLPKTKELYYIEDCLKGKIVDGKFVRDTNPIYDDEDYITPEYLLDGMMVQYVGAPDGNYINYAISPEEYENGDRHGCDQYNYLYYRNAKYILDINDEFKNMDKERIKQFVTSNVPICRKIIIVPLEENSQQ